VRRRASGSCSLHVPSDIFEEPMTSSISLALSLLVATQPASPAAFLAATDAAAAADANQDAGSSEPEGPEPAPAIAASSSRVASGARPSEPRWRGTGLIITAGIFGGIGFGANLGRVISASRLCQNLRIDPQTQS